MKIIAKTIKGLEEVLAEEIKSLEGASDVLILNRAVQFHGDMELLYTANFWLRTALRLIVPIYEFEANTQDEAYQKLYDFEWENHLDLDGTFSISGFSSSDIFKHSKYLSLKTKDALVDRFRDREGKRPDVDTSEPDLYFNIHVRHNKFTLSLDSSGDSLHKRSYRAVSGVAPLNEVLAAGLVKLSGWDGKSKFIDPMCGAGTIPIEAAKIAMNIPPQNKDKYFGFMGWKNYDEPLWDQILEAVPKPESVEGLKIVGCDIDKKVLRIARDNVRIAGLSRSIEIHDEDFFELNKTYQSYTLIINPPYDERIELEDVMDFYSRIGDTFKKKFLDTKAWILSANIPAIKNVGLKASRRFHVMNGPLESKFHKFEIYGGTRKRK